MSTIPEPPKIDIQALTDHWSRKLMRADAAIRERAGLISFALHLAKELKTLQGGTVLDREIATLEQELSKYADQVKGEQRTDDLLACPFCASEDIDANFHPMAPTTRYAIRCNDCNAIGPRMPSVASAERAWIMRRPQAKDMAQPSTPKTAQEGFKIKPLEWQYTDGEATAYTPWGNMHVRATVNDRWQILWALLQQPKFRFPNQRAAQERAQALYEASIRECVEPAEEGGQ